MVQASRRECAKGHVYYKRSDCLTCPICEAEKKPKNRFLALFAAPARRALEGILITSIDDTALFTEEEIGALHGIGPKALEILRCEMKEAGLSFRDEKGR